MSVVSIYKGCFITYIHVMKCIISITWIIVFSSICAFTQNHLPSDKENKDLTALIDLYSAIRDKNDTSLLKNILTSDIDQLVSTGEWRVGMASAVQGMQRSSAATPGSRVLKVERIKMLSKSSAIVDCRYEIQNPDHTLRKMWSAFIVVKEKKDWKITAIRNMLPTN